MQVVQQALAVAGPEAQQKQSLSIDQFAQLVPWQDLQHKFTVQL